MSREENKVPAMDQISKHSVKSRGSNIDVASIKSSIKGNKYPPSEVLSIGSSSIRTTTTTKERL